MNKIIQQYYQSRQKQYADGLVEYFKENSHHGLRRYTKHWIQLIENQLVYTQDMDWKEADEMFLLWLKEI
jgi:hypothetical protein